MCERNHPDNRHLKRFVPFCLAGLLIIGAACGVPDEVKRATVQTGGDTAGTGGHAGSGGLATSTPSSTGGSVTGGTPSTVPASSADLGGKTGGNTAGGGKGGTSVSSKGGSSTGGKTTDSSTSNSAGASGGATTNTSVGGASGGTTSISTGGTGSTGGTTGGATSTSTVPPPANGLGVYAKGITSGNGAIIIDVRIDNKTAQPVDMSAVTMRYWYQEESLGTSLVFDSNYVSIGYSMEGKVTAAKAFTSSSGAGADHYLEFSMTGTLAAQGDSKQNDQFNIKVTVHTSSWSGKVDTTNDYSYDAGAIGYNEKITLHSGGKVIWGTAPGDGGGGTLTPDAGAVDTNTTH
jgi:hypothetical protein